MAYAILLTYSHTKDGQNIDSALMKQLEQKFVEADGRRLKPNKEIRGKT